MIRKYRREITWLGLFTAMIVLLGVGIFVVARSTVVLNSIVMVSLAAIGLSNLISSGCKLIDILVDEIFKENPDGGTSIEYDVDDYGKSVVVLCKNEEQRLILFHEYISRLQSHGVNITSTVMTCYTAFTTDSVFVEFILPEQVEEAEAMDFDEYINSYEGYNETLLYHILEEHGVGSGE